MKLPALPPPGSTDDEVHAFCLAYLHACGCTVQLAEAGEWIAPIKLRERLGLKGGAFAQRLHHPSCPDFPRKMSENGKRIAFIQVTQPLLFWLSLPLHKGKQINGLKGPLAKATKAALEAEKGDR